MMVMRVVDQYDHVHVHMNTRDTPIPRIGETISMGNSWFKVINVIYDFTHNYVKVLIHTPESK